MKGSIQAASAVSLALAMSGSAVAQDFPGIEREVYGKYLKPVKTIGYAAVNSFRSSDSSKSEGRMRVSEVDEQKTKHLHARLAALFPGVPYSEVIPLSWLRDDSVAYLMCNTWLHGEEWPIAFHVECRLGAGAKPRVLTDATLGITSPERASEDISAQVDQLVERIAGTFAATREANP